MNERELVAMAKNGNKDAFCTLYGMYKDKLYRYAFYRLRYQQDAEDAVSECILSAYQQIHNLKNEKAFSSWLFRIMSSCCNSIIKIQIERRNNDNIDDYENSLFSNSNATEKTEITEALSILDDDEKEIVLLSTVAGFNSKEIASFTDYTSGAVRSKLSRSLKKMRNFLEAQ